MYHDHQRSADSRHLYNRCQNKAWKKKISHTSQSWILKYSTEIMSTRKRNQFEESLAEMSEHITGDANQHWATSHYSRFSSQQTCGNSQVVFTGNEKVACRVRVLILSELIAYVERTDWADSPFSHLDSLDFAIHHLLQEKNENMQVIQAEADPIKICAARHWPTIWSLMPTSLEVQRQKPHAK